MVHSLVRTLVKILVASLIVGTILAHFGITAEQIMKEFGLSAERISELANKAFAWALPNMLLGALIIVPIWLLVFLFRPPGPRGND
jgi:acetyl-CoA acetyltransferase